jgi:hypothetical protein
MPDDPRLHTFPDEFVPNVQASDAYKRWAKSSPGDRARWEGFRDAVIATGNGVVPVMSTKLGKALVAAGKEHMSISSLVGSVTPPYPPPGTPPPPSQGTLPLNPPAWTGPLTITSGGTYNGQALGVGWESTSTVPAISIQTTEPVVIEDAWVRNLAGGRLIRNDPWGSNVHVTIRRVRGYGGDHRFIEVEGHRYLSIENCTLEKTGGIRTNVDQSSSQMIIRYNRHHNVRHTPEGFGNFVQLNGTRNGTVLIEWNEIENEYNLSNPEDLISIISGRNVTIANNMLWHNSIPGNPGPGTNGSITLEGGGAGACDNVQVYDNQMIDVATGLYWGTGTLNSNGLRNRLIQDGYLPDGVTRINSGQGGFALLSGCVNCHFHDNVSGYVDMNGSRTDYVDLSGAPEGHAAEVLNNTTLPDPITRQMELDEWTAWQAKLSANSITIGA